MGQYHFKNEQRAEPSATSITTDYLSVFVRMMGILMLLVGLWMGVKVIIEAWALYRGPHHIERFADAIDRGSNMDKVLASFSSKQSKPDDKKKSKSRLAAQSQENFRLSYFLAWVIVIFLLMLIGRLSLGAIKTGGELALYDLQVKRFARQLMEEVQSSSQGKR